MRLICMLTLAASLWACKGGNPDKALRKPYLLEIDLTTVMPTLPDPTQQEPQTAFEISEQLNEIASDASLKGVWVRFAEQPGEWATLQELRPGFQKLRKNGKPVHCYFGTLDHAGYGLAADVCDKLFMAPAGELNWVGLAIEQLFFKDFLNGLGISADIEQVGQYKGTGDMFTQNAMSPALRSSLQALVTSLEDNLIAQVAAARRILPATLRSLFRSGPFASTSAQQAHLVDAIAFEEEAQDALKKLTGVSTVKPFNFQEEDDIKGVHWTDWLNMLVGPDGREEVKAPHVMVAHMVGNIVEGEGEPGQSVGAKTWVRKIKTWRNARHVKGLVLRIDSPGGSAFASDLIWHAVLRFSEKKPVAVSIGNMAASGGYYIASAGERIFANHGSLVGSIGVVGGKISFGNLMKRWGIQSDTVQSSPRASWMSMVRPLSAEEKQGLKAELHRTYKRFLERIATRRSKQLQAILGSAEGQVILGHQAIAAGLVDEVGGLQQAIQWVRQRARLAATSPVNHWPTLPTWVDRLENVLSSAQASADPPPLAALKALLGKRFGLEIDSPAKAWHIWAIPLHVTKIR